ncbi:hypothetical protein [Micromonospora echinaurantiaca]|uniref:hypothetical protein n=1 Tax=Micromonospora echinaurantiaca TaxID=47857 RepID=UPI00378E50FE
MACRTGRSDPTTHPAAGSARFRRGRPVSLDPPPALAAPTGPPAGDAGARAGTRIGPMRRRVSLDPPPALAAPIGPPAGDAGARAGTGIGPMRLTGESIG